MKVRCLANKSKFLPENYLDPVRGYTKELEFNLTLDREYIVYAIKSARGQTWYYLCDDRYTYYPIPNPAPLFEIVDNRLSQYWRLKLAENGLLEIAFAEWLTDNYFYDKLTDQEEKEVLIFERVKELIDAEAASITPQPAVEQVLAKV
ncbi:MAG: hypothetical protein SAJ37_11710 [Oscillatoria sp. PMC 1068.18]|nr:hypothetical protein [Oscillatoria sp. PMC 1076.18]MEC4989406.1 hypothetical protein [Oscillatoria sp. PMC 1068.18]